MAIFSEKFRIAGLDSQHTWSRLQSVMNTFIQAQLPIDSRAGRRSAGLWSGTDGARTVVALRDGARGLEMVL
jgi:hypothetical protein